MGRQCETSGEKSSVQQKGSVVISKTFWCTHTWVSSSPFFFFLFLTFTEVFISSPVWMQRSSRHHKITLSNEWYKTTFPLSGCWSCYAGMRHSFYKQGNRGICLNRLGTRALLLAVAVPKTLPRRNPVKYCPVSISHTCMQWTARK